MCAHVRVCVCLSVCVWRGEWILIIGGHSRGEEVSRPLAHIFQPEQLVEPLRAKALTFHRHARAVEEKWWKKNGGVFVWEAAIAQRGVRPMTR